MIDEKLLNRFNRLSTHDLKSDCVVWTGMVDKDGYAMIKYKGIRKRAARLLYTLLNDTKPEVVGHTCNNKACVNILHLYPTTFKENSNHAKRDGLYRTGVNHPRAIAWKQSQEEHIKDLYKSGKSQQYIANLFGVYQTRISEVLGNKHIKDNR